MLPTDVVRDPAGIVFVVAPSPVAVTTDVITQLAPGAMTVPDGSESEPPPADAIAAPDVHPLVVVTAGVVFTKPDG